MTTAEHVAITHADGRAVHKNLALMVVAIAQLMVVLDATIVNVALGSIASALHVRSQADLSWVVTAYTLTFGGFLLLGGKIADRVGRRTVFVSGAALFAVASLLGGVAGNLGLLIAARGLQGMGGALMSPAALSLITVIFREGEERNKALGIWAGITAGGAALGLVLGGVLTEYASWRWVFLVNVPIAAIAITGALRLVPESKDERATSFDVPGAVLVTGGLMSLVYALVRGNDLGWGSTSTVVTLLLAVVLLIAFVVVQRTSASPLLPTRVLKTRSVLGADLGSLLIGAGIFAIFFFVILWFEQVNGWSPIRAGLSFLPMPFCIGMSAGISSRFIGKVGVRPFLTVGPILAASGLLQLALRLEVHSTYAGTVLPALVCVALGMGMTFVSLTSAAVAGVPHEDAGIASALLNAGQQMGGALGLAILTAVSLSRSSSLLQGFNAKTAQVQHAFETKQVTPAVLKLHDTLNNALVSGWTAGFFVAAAFLVSAAIVANALIRITPQQAEEALHEAHVG
ncbi:MAG: drug resistance transporter, EmrB/QacA subfamily [Frankiales bacterium]|nr:drug resistance transporter, EmrB/QacA subfamily [Frankiales bacterium]